MGLLSLCIITGLILPLVAGRGRESVRRRVTSGGGSTCTRSGWRYTEPSRTDIKKNVPAVVPIELSKWKSLFFKVKHCSSL